MEKNFSKNFRTNKKQRIFVNSMSDVSHWKHEWIIKVLDKIKQHPVHTFIFLTKNPTIYPRYNFPENCLLGITVTNAYDLHTRTARKQWIKNNKSFVSIEPMHGPIVDTAELQDFNWVILGAETGNRKNKIVPAKQWIDIIVAYCLSTNTPLFMKENIIKHYDGKKYTQYGENI